MVNGLWLLLLAFQEAEPAEPAETKMLQARQAFLNEDYAQVTKLLKDLVEVNQGDYQREAMLLSADANFAINDRNSLNRAITLYERCLYEVEEALFPDHCYHQLAEIYLRKSKRAQQAGRNYESREMASEAAFYMRRLVKRFSKSYYRDTSLHQLLELSLVSKHYDRTLEIARSIWDSATNGRLLTLVEPIIFIEQEPFKETAAAIDGVFNAHRAMISTNRDLLFAFAKRYQAVNALRQARQLYLLVYNMWPTWEDSASSLRRLADLHRAESQWDKAAFLYKQIMLEKPNSLAEAEAWLGVAEMMERNQISEFVLDDTRSHSYRDLVDLIRVSSHLPGDVRARYSYKLALFHSFSDVEAALRILGALLNDYERGPFVGLYRNFYERLLYTTVDNKYQDAAYWDLDRMYRDHQKFLAFTTQTRYPHLIAKAYLHLDLPSIALQVFEKMWTFKETITGFDLAFEEPLTDYLELLNSMRRDSKLGFRLADYDSLYSKRDRFPDRFLYISFLHKSRQKDSTMSADENADTFLAYVKQQPTQIITKYDAKRLRLMALTAQENALRYATRRAAEDDAAESYLDKEREAMQLTGKLYANVLDWKPLAREVPELYKEALLFQADELFGLGNYYEAERRYQQILSNLKYTEADRDWAYLQLARLHELKGEKKTSMRIYGQLAYAPGEDSRMLAAYAKQRMFSIAGGKKLTEVGKEKGLGQY